MPTIAATSLSQTKKMHDEPRVGQNADAASASAYSKETIVN